MEATMAGCGLADKDNRYTQERRKSLLKKEERKEDEGEVKPRTKKAPPLPNAGLALAAV